MSYPPSSYQPSPCPPNWYDDPYSSEHYRYWDGTAWTGHVSPKYVTSTRPRTPDGVPLASWWQRVGARLIDQLICLLISVPFTGYFYYRYFAAFQDVWHRALSHPDQPQTVNPFAVPGQLQKWLLLAAVGSFAVAVTYEVVFAPERRHARQANRRTACPAA